MTTQAMARQINRENAVAFKQRRKFEKAQGVVQPTVNRKNKRIRRVSPNKASVRESVRLKEMSSAWLVTMKILLACSESIPPPRVGIKSRMTAKPLGDSPWYCAVSHHTLMTQKIGLVSYDKLMIHIISEE